MSVPKFIPGPAEIAREAVIVVAGALLAAWLMRQWPSGRAYVKAAWQDNQP